MTVEEIVKTINEVDCLHGMTINERLYTTGLTVEFDKAKKVDSEKAIKILELLHVDRLSIEKIIK